MKKILITMLVMSFSLLLSQCSENPSSSSQTELSKSVKIAITIPQGMDTVISTAYVEVTADDMSTIQQKLSINESSIFGVVKNVPAGYDRHFEVFVYGTNGNKLLFYGDSYANIYSGEETYVKIILRQPGGIAIIDGYIEGYNPPSDTIPTPSTPYIYAYRLTDADTPRCYSLSLATNGSVYPDSLEYYWEVIRNNGTDKSYDFHILGELLTLSNPEDGMYRIYVCAEKMYGDTLERSPSSSPLCFTIRNGLLADTIVEVPDTYPPSIKLNGPAIIILPLDSTYIEYGATAYDKVDGDLTNNISISGYVDTSSAGKYSITYLVSDKAGNTAKTIRTIIVGDTLQVEDTIPPVLVLTGDSTVILPLYAQYTEYGAIATDDIDGNLTNFVIITGNFDSTRTGTYSIKYTVKDRAGNCTTIFRTIIVINETPTPDTIPPVITLLGSDSIMLALSDTFVEPGYNAYDNVDGDITSNVTTSKEVYDNSYLIKYFVSDSNGNSSHVHRTIMTLINPLSTLR